MRGVTRNILFYNGFLYIFFFLRLFILELLRCGFARQGDEAREISVLGLCLGITLLILEKSLSYSQVCQERERLTPFHI
jgi:hypothetical protein